VRPPHVHFAAKLEAAIASARLRIQGQEHAGRVSAGPD
jgi:hypothetical protein